jgi:hypothetical protein
MKAPADDTLTLQEAATLAHCGVDLMRELVDSGTVPAVRLNPKHCAIVRDQFLEWLRGEAERQAHARRQKHRGINAGPVSRGPALSRRRGRERADLPSLDDYELTTDARPVSTPADSHSA